MTPLSRRDFLTHAGAAAMLPLASRLDSALPKDPAKNPNVLLIPVDDLNRRLGCYGQAVHTSNIDRLARRAILFRNACCQYPLCNPSRTSLFSGMLPEDTRILDNDTPPRTYLKDAVFLPEQFRRNGYFTARVGKTLHGGFEDAVKWDVAEDPGGRPLTPEQKAYVGQGGSANNPFQQIARKGDDTDEPDGSTARRIVELLEQNKDKPFFISAGFHRPHMPYIAPKKYFDMYPPEKVQLPEKPADDLDDIPPVALVKKYQDDWTDEKLRKGIAGYHACVSFMDAQVGVILDAVDRLKLWDSTVVVFFGDNGFHLGEHHGLWAKMTLFEESAGVPLIIHAPGMPGGKTCLKPVEFTDIYPTLTDLCGVPTPEGLAGRSLRPLLSNSNASWDRPAYTVVRHGVMGRSIRTEEFRYTEWDEGRKGVELYAHRHDPHEYTNLTRDPRHADDAKEMKKLLAQARTRARERV